MRVLILKTSSMGDVIHTLPAITDAANAIDGIEFDWVVEEGFAEIPQWHESVQRVIPVSLRRWRKKIFKNKTLKEWRDFKHSIANECYDKVIDAQGLLKSAFLMRCVCGEKNGYSWGSAREPLASLFYSRRHAIPKTMHAVERIRQLFAHSLDYKVADQKGTYGIHRSYFSQSFDDTIHDLSIPFHQERPFLVFLHGTTRHDKHWPEVYWKKLAQLVADEGFNVYLPWGNSVEQQRAERIAESAATGQVIALPRLNLKQLASIIVHAKGVVAVDTGLGHMTAALSVPAVSLYGATDPALIGAYGNNQIHLLASDCDKVAVTSDQSDEVIDPRHFHAMTPAYVWQKMQQIFD